MHRILSYPEIITGPSHDLWWLVERPNFNLEVLAAGAEAYHKTASLNLEQFGSPTGMHRYTEMLNATLKTLERWGAYGHKEKGQARICVIGPRGQQVQIAVRRADPTDDGYDMGSCRDAMVQLGQLRFESFEFLEGEPTTIGALFLHRVCPNDQDFLEMFMAHRWSTERGWTKILCDESMYLGRRRFRGATGETPEAVGDSPDL
jgi:hypothetical protein